ncbi:MAG: glycoside hydrolase family 36 protein [Candidatus Thorarchaeota archaeon]
MSEHFEMCTLDVGEDIIRLSNGVVAIWFNTLTGTFDFSSADLSTTYFSRGYTQVHTSEKTYDSRHMTYREVTSLDFNDERGKGKAVVIRLRDPEKRIEMNVRLSLVIGDLGYNCIVQLRNKGEALTVNSLEPLVVDVDTGERVQTGWNGATLRYFKNGFHSWELSQAQPLASGENKSHSFSALTNTEANTAIILGFASLADQFTTVSFYGRDSEAERLAQVVASSDAEAITLREKGAIASEELYILIDSAPHEGLKHYIRHVSQNMQARVAQPPVGWCSWYYYFNRPEEEDILENAKFLNSRFEDNIRWIQIDDGFQKTVGDWEENSRFQQGLPSIVKKIKSMGFKAGIWTAPFIASQHSDVFKNRLEWFVRDDDNQPVVAGENPLWLGKFYAFDLTHPQVIQHVTELFDRLKGMGFDYFKVDFLHYATIQGRRHNQEMTRCAGFRNALMAIRKTVGDSFLLGCGAPLGPSIGIFDGMRIGTDIGTDWRYEWGGGVYECAVNVLSRSTLNNRWWINDPDCVLVRQEDTDLKLDEVVLWATIVALNGGVLMLGDKMRDLSENRLMILEKIMPPFSKGAEALDSLVNSEPRIFILPIETPIGQWTVFAAINIGERSINLKVPFRDLRLKEDMPHHVFDFWAEQYEGLYEELFEIKDLAPHTSRLFCVRPESPVPAVLSTSIHYTQGGVELAEQVWDERTQELSLIIKRSVTNPEAVFITLSRNWTPSKAFVDENQVGIDSIAPEVIVIRHRFASGQKLRVQFSKST